MFQTFVEMLDSVTGVKYMGMVGSTIQSKKRAISKLKKRRGWVIDANTGKVVAIEGFDDRYKVVL